MQPLAGKTAPGRYGLLMVSEDALLQGQHATKELS